MKELTIYDQMKCPVKTPFLTYSPDDKQYSFLKNDVNEEQSMSLSNWPFFPFTMISKEVSLPLIE
jgi:hypothetical protein